MSATLQISEGSRAAFLRCCDEVKREVGLEVWDILTDQMALLCRMAIGWTAPFSSPGKQRPDAKDRKIGEQAIKADIPRVFRSLDQRTEDDWRIVLGGSDQVVQVVDRESTGHGRTIIYGVENQLFRPDASVQEMEAHHSKYRRADGKVSRTSETTGWKDIGRWKFLDKMHVRGANFAAFMRYKLGHVGKTKAGWSAAALHFADKTKGRVSTTIPDWITRHGYTSGTWADQFDIATVTGEMAAGNNVPWIGEGRIAAALPKLLAARITDLQSGKYMMRVQKWMLKHQPKEARAA